MYDEEILDFTFTKTNALSQKGWRSWMYKLLYNPGPLFIRKKILMALQVKRTDIQGDLTVKG